jgi:tRNA (adenine22-N1)-methyltransferase
VKTGGAFFITNDNHTKRSAKEVQLKLGKRLRQIESMVTAGYNHIWDCCCDHGLLGAALLARQAAPRIHFVDIAPELMHQLENKLERFYPENSRSHCQWQVHCTDVTALPLGQFNGKHLVIIAGVGGDLMTELVKTIYQQNPRADIDFLLCPVHHQFTLRAQLIEFGFSLKTEALTAENHRFYEILLVSTTQDHYLKINPIGNFIWQSTTPEQAKIAADYLKKTLDHYQRVQLSRHAEVQHIIDAYSAVIT